MLIPGAEQFAGVDTDLTLHPVSVDLLKDAILNLREKGATIIFSTHQMEQVEQMCEDICLINHGTQVLGGNLREVKRGFGRNTVRLDYEGPNSFLGDDLIKRQNTFANYSELLLNDVRTPRRSCGVHWPPERGSIASNWSSHRCTRYSKRA